MSYMCTLPISDQWEIITYVSNVREIAQAISRIIVVKKR